MPISAWRGGGMCSTESFLVLYPANRVIGGLLFN